MNKTEAFQILEIESTKDERAIKNAYRERLAVTNPEDDPEGFKELRAAYEEACRYARQKEEEEQAKPRDTSPSGLWVEKAAEIYGNIRTRRDVNIKLLCFLMDHFKLPTEVWQLLDKRLSIVSDAASLREKFPADFMRYIVSKCERGEDVDFSMFEGPEDGEYDLFLQYYERCWQDLQEDRLEEAEQNLKRARSAVRSISIKRASRIRRWSCWRFFLQSIRTIPWSVIICLKCCGKGASRAMRSSGRGQPGFMRS